MTSFHSSALVLVPAFAFASMTFLAGCGSPARTSTTTTDVTEHPTTGGQTDTHSTETTETGQDGSQSTTRTDTTQSSTPAPH